MSFDVQPMLAFLGSETIFCEHTENTTKESWGFENTNDQQATKKGGEHYAQTSIPFCGVATALRQSIGRI